MVDPRRGTHLATLLPVDKEKNAERHRRAIAVPTATCPAPAPVGIAPLLRQQMADYAATGLPPAYVPDPREQHDLDQYDATQDDHNPGDDEP